MITQILTFITGGALSAGLHRLIPPAKYSQSHCYIHPLCQGQSPESSCVYHPGCNRPLYSILTIIYLISFTYIKGFLFFFLFLIFVLYCFPSNWIYFPMILTYVSNVVWKCHSTVDTWLAHENTGFRTSRKKKRSEGGKKKKGEVKGKEEGYSINASA